MIGMEGDSMSIKKIRKSLNLTQKEASKIVNVPLRTYLNYENDESKVGNIKYEHILNELSKLNFIDETHGLLTIDKIKLLCEPIFNKYEVQYAYLFGSYAKKLANETSDVDLLVSTKTTGIAFYGLIEELRETLNKKVDLISLQSLENNKDLVNEILKDGIKIYG